MPDFGRDTTPTREGYLERAHALVPLLRERSAEAEQLRRMPDATVADLVESGLPRMAQPSRFGGGAMGWDALCECSMALAHGCGAQAWVANVYAEHGYIAGLFSDEAQHDVWGKDPSTLLSASVIPQGNRVEAVDGGYVLDGRWPFSSGAHHASWVVLGEMAPADDGTHQVHFFLVPAADRTILDDWNAVGMAGTGSSSVVLKKAFVPAHRAVDNRLIVAGQAPGAALDPAPVYRMPLLGFSHLALGSVPVGVAESMAEDFTGFVGERLSKSPPRPGTEGLPMRLSEAAAEAQAARLLILNAARANMDKLARGEALDDDDGAICRRDGSYAVLLARRAAQRIFEATGAHGLDLGARLQRSFRDIFGAGAHAGLNWDRAASEYGRRRAGV